MRYISAMSIEKRVKKHQKLSRYSTFGIGGEALFLIEALSVDDLRESLYFAKEQGLPYFIVGRGSNLLFDDRGFDGVIICNKIDYCKYDSNCTVVGGGKNFSALGLETASKNLSGLEFAAGIPGSVGGAIFMNASSGGQEVKQPLRKILFLLPTGNLQTIEAKDLTFSYRFSSLQEMKGIIVEATFELLNSKDAIERQTHFLAEKSKNQPLKAKSAGCVFKNPTNFSAGKIIDECGLKGKKIGGAIVSLLHANFILNEGEATATDVLNLIDHVKEEVEKKMKISLELEIKYVPYRI